MTTIEGNIVYELGDRVRIVDRWDPGGACQENERGEMDKYLGTVMTIESVKLLGGDPARPEYRMVEDRGEGPLHCGWFWNKACIQELDQPAPNAYDFYDVLKG